MVILVDKSGGTSLPLCRVSCQKNKTKQITTTNVGRHLSPENVFNQYFKIFVASMVLKCAIYIYVRNVVLFFY